MVKITRSFPAPASLEIERQKPNGSYREHDVIAQLMNDFHGKCYICEQGALQDPEVEHRLPHLGSRYPERKFDWSNLFLSCGHCNSIKNNRKYDEGIIDCCRRDPEDVLEFLFSENDVHVEVLDESDQEATLTAELTEKVFNLRNTGIRDVASSQRIHNLGMEMNTLYTLLEKHLKYPENNRIKRTLAQLLKRETSYAGFKRSYVRKHKDRYPSIFSFLEG